MLKGASSGGRERVTSRSSQLRGHRRGVPAEMNKGGMKSERNSRCKGPEVGERKAPSLVAAWSPSQGWRVRPKRPWHGERAMSVKLKSTWRPQMADVGLGRGKVKLDSRLLGGALGRLPSGCGKLGHPQMPG